MLPSYTPLIRTIQNHIHIGLAGGSGFGPYGEPPYKITHVQTETPHLEIMSSFNRSIDGTPLDHTLRDSTWSVSVPGTSQSNNKSKIFKDFQYTIRIDNNDSSTLYYEDLLGQFVGQYVVVVPVRHCNDNVNHTPYIRTMKMIDFQVQEYLDPFLQYPVIQFTLKDMDTVPLP